jgi:hypothetical protein
LCITGDDGIGNHDDDDNDGVDDDVDDDDGDDDDDDDNHKLMVDVLVIDVAAVMSLTDISSRV